MTALEPEKTIARPAAVAIVIAAVVAAIIVVGGAVSLGAERLPAGPEVAPPTSELVVRTPISFDPTSRRASVQELHFVAPASPYTCMDAPKVQPGVFTSYLACDAPVHKNYSGSKSWYSSIGCGVLDDPLIVPDDLDATVGKVADAVLGFYPADSTTIKNRKVEKLVAIAPSGKGVLLSMRVHVKLKDLPTKYDRVIVAVFQLANGEHVTWFAANADDSPKSLTKVLNDSVNTVNASR